MTEVINTAPAADKIDDGVIMVGSNSFMADTKGALIPLSLIKPQKKLEDETVRKVISFAEELHAQIVRFRAHTMKDLGDLDALLEQQYNFVKAGNAGKGNRTYSTFDGLMQVKVTISDLVEFGPELQIAHGLVVQCLTEWGDGADPRIQALVTRAFNTDKEGKINRALIYMLLGLDIDEPRWNNAMKAITDAMRVVDTKQYVGFRIRSSHGAPWMNISIDLANA